MKILVPVVLCAAGLGVLPFVIRKRKSVGNRECSFCGAPPTFGYSEHAEETKGRIKPVCLNCLASQLENEFAFFSGRALVVRPAEGPPVYVFQPVKEWRERFTDTRIADDVVSLLEKMDRYCAECGNNARFLWVDSDGLTGENFGECLDKGVSKTLLPHNQAPVALCSKCCVKRLRTELEARRLCYLEVSPPRGSEDGFVMPMGY